MRIIIGRSNSKGVVKVNRRIVVVAIICWGINGCPSRIIGPSPAVKIIVSCIVRVRVRVIIPITWRILVPSRLIIVIVSEIVHSVRVVKVIPVLVIIRVRNINEPVIFARINFELKVAVSVTNIKCIRKAGQS